MIKKKKLPNYSNTLLCIAKTSTSTIIHSNGHAKFHLITAINMGCRHSIIPQLDRKEDIRKRIHMFNIQHVC